MTSPSATEVRRKRLVEAMDAIKMLCDYAYEQGFHEMGYDPVEEVREALLSETGDMELARHLNSEHHAMQAWAIDNPMNACSLKETCLWLKRIALTPAVPSASVESAQPNLAAEELWNIFNADRFNRELFRDDTEFADWARNRAQHTWKKVNEAPRSAIAPTTAAFACDGEGLTMRCPSQCAKCAEKAAAALRLLRSFPGHFYEQAYNGWLNERDRLVGDAMDSSGAGTK